METDDEIQAQLMKEINEAVRDIRMEKLNAKTGHGLMIVGKPERVAKALYYWSTGMNEWKIEREYGVSAVTLRKMLVWFADKAGRFRELGGQLSAQNYVGLSNLEQDLMGKLSDRLNASDYVPEFRDLKDVAYAKQVASKEALTARGEVSAITEERKIYTQEDYEDTIRAARERLEKLKQVEEVSDV